MFVEWWESLAPIQQVLAYIAIPSTLILIIQTILILVGVGSHGAGVDISDTSGLDIDTSGMDVDTSFGDAPDVHHGHAFDDGSAVGDFATMNLFTVQGIVSFLAMFSWSTIVSINLGLSGNLTFLAFLIGLALGYGAMYFVAKMIQLSSKLTQNGTLVMKNLLGHSGSVYLTIPEKGAGQGKVNISIHERYLEMSAITDDEEPLKTGEEIRVIDIRGDVLVVEAVK